MTSLQGIRTVVYDAYGTLFDFSSAVMNFSSVPEEKKSALVSLWREKQLQYTWLRTLQNKYVNFEQVTIDALNFALEATVLTDSNRCQELLDLYRVIEAYPEVKEVLQKLKTAGMTLAILSNGTPAMLSMVLDHAELNGMFDHVFSVDSVGVFKTHPSAYQIVPDTLKQPASEMCFISSNGWDAYACADYGFHVVWCNRSGQPRERLPCKPEVMVKDLQGLPALFGV